MQQLQEQYNIDRINYLKNNKSEITPEILDELRSFGQEGKQLALEVLELQKGEKLSDIHISEFKRCQEDVLYFRNNYVKLHKYNGIFFAETDEIQDEIISLIIKNRKVLIDTDIQTKKSTGAAVVILHKFLFEISQTIGLVSKNQMLARDNLARIEQMYSDLPDFFKIPGTKLNKTNMYSKSNGNHIFIDNIDKNAFRGRSMNFILVDCAIGVPENKVQEFMNTILPSISAVPESKLIILEDTLTIDKKEFVQWDGTFNSTCIEQTPVQTEKPILKRALKQIIKDFYSSLYIYIKDKIKG